MFLHSGAGLHGHEYSSRDTPATGNASPRRNSLLRSSFTTPINRVAPHADSCSPSSSLGTTSTSVKRVKPRPTSDYLPASPETIVRFVEPLEHVPISASTAEDMSEDEASTVVDISDSDISHATSLTRRPRRRSNRQRTSYLLAQAPPSLNQKQRLLHIRPKLLLQLQQVPINQRPRPTIDVYPTSGIVNTAIAAHLCKRFPRLSRIKSEKSIQDVVLLKSQDYATSDVESDSDGDEESIKDRDIIAILSPLAGQDKAEIALPDGTIWVAAPAMKNNRLSYEFTTVDAHGKTTVARWVRRQIATTSEPVRNSPTPSPSTPSSPISPSYVPYYPFPPASPPPDYKFTFSIIDPSCRQHPVMATLLPSSLEVQDTYTTVSQSSSRYPPTSQQVSSSDFSEARQEAMPEKATRSVEEWQKSFIQISALWVALRHGWVPHFKLADFIPQSASVTSLPGSKPKSHSRSRSYSTGTDVGSSTMSRTLTGRLRNSQPPLEEEKGTFSSGVLPRRATSTGAARMQKYRAERLSEATELDETSSIRSKGRRVLSGDWNVGVPKRNSTALAGFVDSESPEIIASQPTVESVTSPVVSSGTATPSKRPVSEFYTSSPTCGRTPKKATSPTVADVFPATSKKKSRGLVAKSEADDARKHHRWRSVTTWFSKLRTR